MTERILASPESLIKYLKLDNEIRLTREHEARIKVRKDEDRISSRICFLLMAVNLETALGESSGAGEGLGQVRQRWVASTTGATRCTSSGGQFSQRCR